MNRFNNKEVKVEVIKKKRRRPFNASLLDKDTVTEKQVDREVNNAIDIVKKRKEEQKNEEREKLLRQQKEAEEALKLEEDKKRLEYEALHKAKIKSEKFIETPVIENDKKSGVNSKVKDKKEFNDEEKGENNKFKGKLGIKSSMRSRYDSDRRRDSKIVIQNIDIDEERQERRSFASIKRAREKERAKKLQQGQANEKYAREVILPEFITVSDLAVRMSEKGSHVIKELMKLGVMVTLSQTIDADTAELVIDELGHKAKRVTDADVENILIEDDNSSTLEMVARPPIVTVVGHVDHGKTSLLDALRETNVTSSEAGGITQHIGAYQVSIKDGNSITFIDTPGHEAFTSMRSRGVTVTDIVVLVVAADDGIKEQTIEAINHAKAAKVPIIVAINKIDKENADPTKVTTELLSHDLIAESMGGDVIVVEVSALKKVNLDKLLEAILLQAEMLDLKANYEGNARGAVIESRMDRKIGVIATVLVQKGTIKKGDIIVAGIGCGKVKALINDHGKNVSDATPSVPVEVIGFDKAPDAGEMFTIVGSEKQAREVCEYRIKKATEQKSINLHKSKGSLNDLFKEASKSNVRKNLAIIIKGDVHGSVEAISSSLQKIESDEINLNILHKATGGVTESDISLAKASTNALVVAFNVRANNNAKILSEKENIEIRYYSIIYELIEEVKKLMSGMLDPIKTELYIGKAQIRQVFNVSKIGKVGGSFVTDGLIKRGAGVRLVRDNIVIHEGTLKTLKRFKDDVKEVATGYECGIAFENYDDIKEGDVVEAFDIIEKQREI